LTKALAHQLVGERPADVERARHVVALQQANLGYDILV
jgi:hypothetical protein